MGGIVREIVISITMSSGNGDEACEVAVLLEYFDKTRAMMFCPVSLILGTVPGYQYSHVLYHVFKTEMASDLKGMNDE